MRRRLSLSLCALATMLAGGALAAQAPPAQATPPGGGRKFVAIGCVSRQPSGRGGAAAYILTDPRGTKPTVYRLEADPKTADLDFHVGHIVEAAGPLTAAADGSLVMRISSLVYISRTCK